MEFKAVWRDRLSVVVITKRFNHPVDISNILQRFIPKQVKFLTKNTDDGLGRSRIAILRAAS